MNGESHPEDMADEEQDWPSNYFNYFTEVEEHFTRARGTGLFMLSPLDWALIESWKNAGVPLEAILRGIDSAFDKWRSRKTRTQMVNSLAFCAQAVMSEAEEMAGTADNRSKRQAASAPFPGRGDEIVPRSKPARARAAPPVLRKSPPAWSGCSWRPTPYTAIWNRWNNGSPRWRTV